MRTTLTRGSATALLPALAVLAVLVLAGCGNESDSGASPSTSPSATAPSTSPSDLPATSPTAGKPNTGTPSNTADPSGEQADVTVSITVANGKVNPSGATVKVKAGQSVLVTAVSDVADEVHIHGYEKELSLTPGKPASVTFTADMKGTFEIETHENGKLVAKLVVS